MKVGTLYVKDHQVLRLEQVRGFEIMTYSRPFNFAVSYQSYFTVSYINVVFSYTNESRNPVC